MPPPNFDATYAKLNDLRVEITAKLNTVEARIAVDTPRAARLKGQLERLDQAEQRLIAVATELKDGVA